MTIKTYTYHLHELTDYINWLYFFHSWGFPPQFASIARQHACPACQQAWVNSFPIAEREKARTCLKLYQEAIEQLQQLDKDYVVRGICGLFQVRPKMMTLSSICQEKRYIFHACANSCNRKKTESIFV